MSRFAPAPIGPGARPPRWPRRRRVSPGLERAAGAQIARGVRLLIEGDGRIVVGSTGRIGKGCELRAGPGALITVDGVLDEDCRLSAKASITVKAGARLGPGCAIVDWDPVYADPERPVRNQGTQATAVLIAADVLLGPRSAVLRGVTVGVGAVVLAQAVCTHDVPPGTEFPAG